MLRYLRNWSTSSGIMPTVLTTLTGALLTFPTICFGWARSVARNQVSKSQTWKSGTHPVKPKPRQTKFEATTHKKDVVGFIFSCKHHRNEFGNYVCVGGILDRNFSGLHPNHSQDFEKIPKSWSWSISTLCMNSQSLEKLLIAPKFSKIFSL